MQRDSPLHGAGRRAGIVIVALLVALSVPVGTATADYQETINKNIGNNINTEERMVFGTLGESNGIAEQAKKPDNPDNPDKPDKPAKPDEPDKPDRPKEPDKPDKPEKPDEPAEPDRPDKPDKPEKPEEPDKPEEPEKPDKPDEPEKPDKPDEPEKPDKPDEPEKPDKPDKPEKPDEPDKPDKPENPEKPDEPDKPDKPEDEEGDNFAHATSLTLGVTEEATLGQGDVDVFSIDLAAGTTVNAAYEYDFDGVVFVTLYGPNRQQIESKRIEGRASGELSLTAPRDGTYYLRLHGIERTTGSYALTVTEEGAAQT